MPQPTAPPALWPGRLVAAATALRGAPPATREPCRAALWTLLHAALFASLRAQAGRVAPVAHEDLEDLASQKALELLLRTEEGAWDPGGRPDHEVGGYVARVARHALVDLARRRGRECPPPDDADAWAAALVDGTRTYAGPEDEVDARRFARELKECVAVLAPRARSAWFGRVFLERPSRELAKGLGLKPGHLDVIVQRARRELRACMERKGYADAGLRPGAFVELWQWMAEAAAGSADAAQGDSE